VLRSGTGLWLLWLLHDDQSGGPPHVTPDHVALFNGLQRKLSDLLEDLKPDRGGQDLVRLMRLPGTTNRKRPGLPKVGYLVRRTPEGRTVRYALDALAATLGVIHDAALPVAGVVATTSPRVSPPVDLPLRRSRPNPTAPPESPTALLRRILQPFRRFQSRVDGLLELERMRSGFAEGHRNRAVYLIGYFSKRALYSDERQETLLRQVAGRCRPPLPESETLTSLGSARQAVDQLRGKGTRGYIADARMIDWLDVTDEERRVLGWRATPTTRRPPGTRTAEGNARRQRMEVLVQEHGGDIPSYREMVRWLAEADLTVSRGTVANDYRTLEWASSSRATAKPRA
jgi:hypothetical protein